MNKSHDEVVDKIKGRKGKRVTFTYPGKEGKKLGVLKDRVVIKSIQAPGTVPYWDVVDLIEFADEKEPDWIRIGYYRKPGKNLVWGSQTTITEPIFIWKRIIVEAALEKPWFRSLLEDAMKDISKAKPKTVAKSKP